VWPTKRSEIRDLERSNISYTTQNLVLHSSSLFNCHSLIFRFVRYAIQAISEYEIISNILSNMCRLYAYSEEIALDTIVFALKKEIIEFEEIL